MVKKNFKKNGVFNWNLPQLLLLRMLAFCRKRNSGEFSFPPEFTFLPWVPFPPRVPFPHWILFSPLALSFSIFINANLPLQSQWRRWPPLMSSTNIHTLKLSTLFFPLITYWLVLKHTLFVSSLWRQHWSTNFQECSIPSARKRWVSASWCCSPFRCFDRSIKWEYGFLYCGEFLQWSKLLQSGPRLRLLWLLLSLRLLAGLDLMVWGAKLEEQKIF